MTTLAFELEHSLTFATSQLASRLQDQFNAELSVLDISWPQWLVIHSVATGLADTPASIAVILGVNRSAITRLLDRLQQKGLIDRSSDQEDRRSIKVRISDAGLLLVDYMDAAAARHESRLIEVLGEGRCNELREMLSRATSAGLSV